MSYYNDFSLALEQQSNELDTMLAELDNTLDSGVYSEALESVQNTVASMYDVDACEVLLDQLSTVTESYNSAMEQMRDAAEMYQYTNDAESTREALFSAQESLKEIYANMVGYAPEGAIDTEMISEIRNFLTGSKDIIEGRMNELGGYSYAGESYSMYDQDYEDVNYPLCEAYSEMNLACESYYDCIEAGYAEYGYAFEAEASGAEKAQKEGLFARMKKSIKDFCVKMANTCRTKRDSTQNKALKGIYNSFYGIFMRLSGQADQLKEERAADKLRKEAEKQKDELNKQVSAANGNPTSTDPTPGNTGKVYTKNQIEKMLKGVDKQFKDPAIKDKSALTKKQKHLRQILDVVNRRDRTQEELNKTKDPDKRNSLQAQIRQDNDQIADLMQLVNAAQAEVHMDGSVVQHRRNEKLNKKWSDSSLTKDQRRKKEDFGDRHTNNGNKIPAPANIQAELDKLKREIGSLKNETPDEEKRNPKGNYAKQMKQKSNRVREIREKYIVKEAYIEDYAADFALESFFNMILV